MITGWTAEDLRDLPVDERALLVLADYVAGGEWSGYNYLLAYKQQWPDAADAVAEAFAWLHGKAYVAAPAGAHDSSIFVTARGQAALANGLATVRAEARLGDNLHPLLKQRTRRQFLLGEYEQAVFVAMKTVEIRVRKLAKFGDDLVGVDLMSRAFNPQGGPLRDSGAVKAEQVGVMNLFQGAYAVLRNPAGHREVDYDDVTEAAEAVVMASLLMRILDRVEGRLRRGN
jgi:uncharacterized protein (TIGR02391 family)